MYRGTSVIERSQDTLRNLEGNKMICTWHTVGFHYMLLSKSERVNKQVSECTIELMIGFHLREYVSIDWWNRR